MKSVEFSQAAIEAVCRCLTDCQGEARRCALKTLSCIAEEGDPEAQRQRDHINL